MSNGWFVSVDTAFIIVIVRPGSVLRQQAGWPANRQTWSVSKVTHQSGVAYLWKYIFWKAALHLIAAGSESVIIQSDAWTSIEHETMLLPKEIHSLKWFNHAHCQSVVSMSAVNKNWPICTVNHQGGKTRQSHLLQFPALLLHLRCFWFSPLWCC